ncbi:MAG TPA: hydroxyacid dehydrogenase [Deltaproteobacteria bacterium]|nr:MAG: hypothetical protein A2Z79_11395 [Deltaproteobacteria bacterium GWA2_55_82]OGQ63573.1 MAG: hypothetical protein A3I81_05580 [Deltaproteobacteria bacterium RIFCSPLOWO2_02_FULL_55_12]OIJ75170.1 MAG: hypothetical protein A2V21_311635 [Deltaproteobacteria bacterium GWC2_55_46]HBG47494.1 hydroxyacid dehydrogenase [Deltaproteobacteria bacterium]HCY11510.1 hydroxyacid dehydrogenase [Deltaproteobacteria bacterium]
MKKVLISTTSFGKHDYTPVDLLTQSGFEPVMNPYGRTLRRDEVIDLASGASGIIAGTEPLDRTVLEKLPGLRIISRCGAGLDNVDMAAARRFGVEVYSTPYGPTLAVAELTVALALNLMRRVTEMDREIRAGMWQKMMGSLLSGKRLGILGFGRIGRKVAELMLPFGVDIFYCDPCRAKDEPGCRAAGLRELLSWAEIVTVHAAPPGTAKRVIGKAELALMRQGSCLINTSRGGVVDEAALYEALIEKRISGAALDVFEEEPYSGRLRELKNVILTPHIGSYAKEARVGMELAAVNNLLAGFGVGAPVNRRQSAVAGGSPI